MPQRILFGTGLTPNGTPKKRAILTVVADDDFGTILV